MRISLFVHDLATNPIVRAAALARALERDYEVELVGFLLSGPEVYAPYRDRFTYRVLRVPNSIRAVAAAVPRLAALATGEVIYGCKPLLTSFVPAMWAARVAARKPLLLDVEDDECVALADGRLDFVRRHVLKGWRHATAWKYTRAVHLLLGIVDGVSVSTTVLQRCYGGTIVRHGPDQGEFDPALPSLADPVRCRRRWALPTSAPLALFAGLPQPHKGWPVLLDALQRPDASAWHLVLAGPPAHPDFETAAALLGNRCHRIGFVSNDGMPSLLAAVDAVPVPQLDVPFARTQLPAKLVEAMAMARAVITTTVGDLPDILASGARGYLVPPGDAGALAAALATVVANPDEARARGRAAREWFLEHASVAATRARLAALLDRTYRAAA